MKRLLFILSFIIPVYCFSQVTYEEYDTTFSYGSGTWKATVWLPSIARSVAGIDSFQCILFCPGAGEAGQGYGTNLPAPGTGLRRYGPLDWKDLGGTGVFNIDGVNQTPIYINLEQIPDFIENEANAARVDAIVDVVRARYRIKTKNGKKCLHGFGLSSGCGVWQYYVGSSTTRAAKLMTVVSILGVPPNTLSPYPSSMQRFANAGGKILYIEGTNDGRDMASLTATMNAAVPNSAILKQTNKSCNNVLAGFHGCFNWWLGGNGSGGGDNYLNPIDTLAINGRSESTYSWALREGFVITGGGSGNPIAAAGPDQAFYRTRTATSLDGSSSIDDVGITSYQWLKVSGPAGGTLSSPTTATTNVSSLQHGVYVYSLTVGDVDGHFNTDFVTVTVQGAPVVNAGSDQTVNQGTTVNLSASVYDDGAIFKWNWFIIKLPSTGNQVNGMLGSSTGVCFLSPSQPDSCNWKLLSDYYIANGLSSTPITNVSVTSTDFNNGMPTGWSNPLGKPAPDPLKNLTFLYNNVSGMTNVFWEYTTNALDATENTPTHVKNVYKEARDSTVARGKKFNFITPKPREGFSPAEELKVKEIVDTLKKNFPLEAIDIWYGFTDGNTTDTRPEFDLNDGVHYNANGQYQVYQTIAAHNNWRLPTTASFSSPNSQATQLSNLPVGTTLVKVSVQDQDSLWHSDIVAITVNATTGSVNANAGPDRTIDYKQSYAFLDGTGSTGTGITYSWRLINPSDQPSVGHIVHPLQAYTPVRILPYNPQSWQYELTVTDGVSTDKDTMFVTVTWPDPPPQATTGPRAATAADTLLINSLGNPGLAKIGDVIIDGANDKPSGAPFNIDIYVPDFGSNTFPNKRKVLINASSGTYGNIYLDWNPANITATAGTTWDSAIVVTGYGGQLRWTGSLTLHDAQKVNFTGEYVAGRSGHPLYKGLGDVSNYDFPTGTFGMYGNAYWGKLGGANLGVNGLSDSVRIAGVEAGNGAFATFFLKEHDTKQNQVTTYFRGFEITKNYLRDGHGELLYSGDTGGDSIIVAVGDTIFQHLLQGWRVHDNMFVRAGNESYQLGQQGGGMWTYNNVMYLGSLNWGSPFHYQQDFNNQHDFRQGGNRVFNNINVRAGEQVLSVFNVRKHGIVWNGDSTIIENNLFTHSLGNITAYVNGSNPTVGSKLVVRNNRFGNNKFRANEIFVNSSGINTQEVLRTQVDGQMTVSVHNNISDNTKTGFVTRYDAKVDTFQNSKVASIPYPQFNNTGFANTTLGDSAFAYNIERWVDTFFRTNGDEYPNQESDVRQGQVRIYNLGDYVVDLGRIYKSRINSNQGNMPYPADSTNWQIQTWFNIRTGLFSTTPPDDLRLPASGVYKQLGMGLTEPAPAGYIRSFIHTIRWRYGAPL